MKLKLENKEYVIISATKKAGIVDIEFGKSVHPLSADDARLMEDVLTSITIETALNLIGLETKEATEYITDYLKEKNESIYITKLNNKLVYSFINNYTNEKTDYTNDFVDIVYIAKTGFLSGKSL